jgi:hypothetical protein
MALVSFIPLLTLAQTDSLGGVTVPSASTTVDVSGQDQDTGLRKGSAEPIAGSDDRGINAVRVDKENQSSSATSTEETYDDKVSAAIKKAASLQDEFHKKNGKYLQIKERQRLPVYENGKAVERLGGTVSDNVSINTYEGPSGKGYQIVYRDKYMVYAVGYGPDADALTYNYARIDEKYTHGDTEEDVASSTDMTVVSEVPSQATSTVVETTATSTDESDTDETPGDGSTGATSTPAIDRRSDKFGDESDDDADDAPSPSRNNSEHQHGQRDSDDNNQ